MSKKLLVSLFIIAAVTASIVFFSGGKEAYSRFDSYSYTVHPTLQQNIPVKRNCGTMEYMEELYRQDPSYKKRMEDLEKYAEEYTRTHQFETDERGLIIIPVVVHVVWNTPVQNISDDQILSQIDVLNADFRRRNLDTANTPAPFKPLAADCNIEFRMARRDPGGNPTLGITRTQTSTVAFGQSSSVKFTSQGGQDGWDRDRYLNLWVCNIGNDILGYATFPGGTASLDGVVIGYTYFGTTGAVTAPFNKGRTATHEVGHWLWLYHIWGDDNGSCAGSDQVGDTPNQAEEFYGCPAYPRLDACTPSGSGVMFMNYMDYTDDACMNLFTQGQLGRMDAALGGPRAPITTSNGHVNVSGNPICTFKADSVSVIYGGTVNFTDLSAGIPTGWQWTFTGANISSSTSQNPTVTYSTPGYYTVRLRVSNSFGADSLTKTSYIKVRGAAMNQISVISPPTLTRVNVAANDTSKVNFTWTKASSDPTIKYKVKFRKVGSTVDYSFNSNSNGSDTTAGLTRSSLDSLAAILGTTGDSVRCSWRAWGYNGVDSTQSNNTNLITLVRSTIGIQVISTEVPERFALYNNYPNPFNPVTKIKFDIPSIIKDNIVKVTVYDILGKEQAVLVNQNLKAGRYEADWDASAYPSGVYFYRITAGEFTDTRKMILVK